MRYLVTGGAGFIGSHLVEALLEAGDEVLILDDLSTGSYGNIAHLEDRPGMTLMVDSVTNPAAVAECVRQADAVYHLASAVGVRLIIEQPVKSIQTMIDGTENVLDCCARYRRPMLLTSTSEVYGNGSKVPFAEDDDRVMGATTKRRWSYACAKALDEFLALAHHYKSSLPVYIVRLFNTVGPRQTGQYGMVVPTFVRQGLRGETITVYGDGNQSRCFCHVKDVVGALGALIREPEARGRIYNVGSDQEISIMALAEKVRAATGGKSAIQTIPYAEAYGEGFDDMRRRVPDLGRVHALIGYRPQHDLDDILTDVIAWERRHLPPVAVS